MKEHEHSFVYGGVKYEDSNIPLSGTGARERTYFDWFFCASCSEYSFIELDCPSNTYEEVQFSATPKPKKRWERGQSLVELAISIVVLMFLLAGAVEFGLVFFQFVQLRDAAQEGALYGSVCLPTCTDDDIVTRATGASTSPIDLVNDPSLEVVVTWVDGNGDLKNCEGDGVEVKMIYQHKIFLPFIPQMIGGDVITLPASVTDTVLVPAC